MSDADIIVHFLKNIDWRLRANRLKVWKKGMLLAETAEVVASLTVANRPTKTAFFKAS